MWGRVLMRLNERVRVRAGRDPQPSAVIIDSQSVKSGGVSEEVGYDGGKKVNGRRRHTVVDVFGLLVARIVCYGRQRAGTRRSGAHLRGVGGRHAETGEDMG